MSIKRFTVKGIATIALIAGSVLLPLPVDAAGGSGYRVQLAAYRSAADARAALAELVSAYADLLGSVGPGIERADLGPGRGVYYRLRTAYLESEQAATRLCRELKSRDQDCLVVPPSSDRWRREPEAVPSELTTKIETLSEKVADLAAQISTRGVVAAENGESNAGGNGGGHASDPLPPSQPPPPPPQIPPAPAVSESPPRKAEVKAPQGYIEALGGLTFQTEPGIFAAGGLLFNVTPRFQLFGEIGYMANVLPQSDQREFDNIAFELSRNFGMPVAIESKAPFLYGMGGGRFFLTEKGTVRPYLSAGAGLARGRETRRIFIGNRDLTEDFKVLGDDLVETDDTTAFLIALGGGINVTLGGALTLDAGYRYTKLLFEQQIFFHENTLNVSRVYVGLGYGF